VDSVDLLSWEAREFGRRGRYTESLARYSRVLALEPVKIEALHYFGVLTADAGIDVLHSLAWIERSLYLDFENPHFLTNKAIILQRLKRNDEALILLEKALTTNRYFVPANLNCGHVYKIKNQFPLAAKFYERVVVLAPADIAAYEHLSFCYSYPDSLNRRCYVLERARFIEPSNADVGFSLSTYYLLSGRFAEGWDLFESRWYASKFRDDFRYSKPLRLSRPEFDANEPVGPIFIWGEQGVGDEVMFGSLIAEFIERFGLQVILQVDPRLVSIFQRSLSDVRVIPRGVSPSEDSYRSHLPLGDLPRILRRDLENFVGVKERFLYSDPVRQQALKSRVSTRAGRVVGISWHTTNGDSRCVPLLDLVLLLRRLDVFIVNLQYGDHGEEIDAVEKIIGGPVFDFAEVNCRDDLEGLLALVQSCDLVISIGNATVHFAGVSGVPTFALLPHFPGWRWLSQGDESVWYRSVKLFRQNQDGNWQSVIDSVEKGLRDQLFPSVA